MDIVTVTFDGVLHNGEEQMFRGALLKKLGDSASSLFHNHTSEGYRFSYPLIQYKVLDGSPILVGIGQGGVLLMGLPKHHELTIGKNVRTFDVRNISINPYEPVLSDDAKMYAIKRYIPLNENNVHDYERLPALTDRICFLENIINANILAFFKGIGFHCEDEIHTAISSIDKTENLYYKGVRFRGYDLTFITNVTLPDNIGLGKSSSVGFGILKRIAIPKRFLPKLTEAE